MEARARGSWGRKEKRSISARSWRGSARRRPPVGPEPVDGFFAENAALVRKIEEARLVFIGPTSPIRFVNPAPANLLSRMRDVTRYATHCACNRVANGRRATIELGPGRKGGIEQRKGGFWSTDSSSSFTSSPLRPSGSMRGGGRRA